MNNVEHTYDYSTRSSDVLEVSLKDLLAIILLRWKTILASMILVILAACGIANLRASVPLTVNERLELSRSQLTERQVADVEAMRARYLAYQEYQSSMQDDYARYLSNASRAEDYVLLHAGFYMSTVLEGLDKLLPETLLSEEDYRLIRESCSPEDDLSSVFNRVTISTVKDGSDHSSENDVTYRISMEPDGVFHYYFLVTVYGTSESECDALMQIVESAVNRKTQLFREMDPQFSVRLLEKEYTRNTQAFVKEQIDSVKTILNDIETQMLNLTNNRISRLTASEKSYYDLLFLNVDDSVVPGKQVAWKKAAVLGAFLGAFLSILILTVLYLFDGKVKIPGEAEAAFHTCTLQRLPIPGKKNLFGKWAASLSGISPSGYDANMGILVKDLQILMKKNNWHRLHFICSESDSQSVSVAEEVCRQLALVAPDIALSLGNPLSSSDALEQLSAADGAVVLVQLRRTHRDTLVHWQEICARYRIAVAGTVSAELCW